MSDVSMNESKALTVNCPTCKKSVTWGEDSPYRPFCGKRCQQLGFGAWASEQFSIPGDETMPPAVSPGIDLQSACLATPATRPALGGCVVSQFGCNADCSASIIG